MRLKLRAGRRAADQMEKTRNLTTAMLAGGPGIAPRNDARRDTGNTSPAPIDHELGAAAVVDPHAGTVPAPAVAFGTARVGHLVHQADLSAPADIDLAHLVALLVAVALQADLAIPARTGPPAAAVAAVAAATIVAIVPAPAGLHELPATAAIHPQPLPVDAPALIANAGTFRLLPRQLGVVPRDRAAIELAVRAFAADRTTRLRLRRRRRRHRKRGQQADRRAQQYLL